MAWPITLKRKNAFFVSFFAKKRLLFPTTLYLDKTSLAANTVLIDSGTMLTGPLLLASFKKIMVIILRYSFF